MGDWGEDGEEESDDDDIGIVTVEAIKFIRTFHIGDYDTLYSLTHLGLIKCNLTGSTQAGVI